MPVEILMPALSPTMTEGKLFKWLKGEGDSIEPGDAVAEIETDKATMEVEAVDSGILQKILVAEDTEGVPVNTPIAVLLLDGEDTSTPSDNYDDKAPPIAEQRGSVPSVSQSDKSSPIQGHGRVDVYTQTVREALRDAMAEEMRKDDAVFVMGEEVA